MVRTLCWSGYWLDGFKGIFIYVYIHFTIIFTFWKLNKKNMKKH